MPRERIGGGSRKGIPNKATADVRAAIAIVAEGCAPKIKEWLDAIEDAGKRLDLYLKMLEYHIPKLGRVEVTGKDGGPLEVKIVRFGDTAPQLGPASVPDAGMASTRTGMPPRSTVLEPPKR